MPANLKAGIYGDAQRPYHDPWAESVAGQIFADAKLDLLISNGDEFDFRMLSRYPTVNPDDRLITELRDEVKRGREGLYSFVKAVGPKRFRFHEGNHEWRVLRAFEKAPQTLQLLGMAEMLDAISMANLMKLKALPCKVEIPGRYPVGSWLHSGIEPGQKNVWVEHGYTVRKKAGYTATNLMEDRGCSVVVNHVEKLAGPLWKRQVGYRYIFNIENGNLSVIGEERRPEMVYGGVPHGEPQLLNHCQGFSLIFYEAGEWWPFVVRIKDGKAMWNGKLYSA